LHLFGVTPPSGGAEIAMETRHSSQRNGMSLYNKKNPTQDSNARESIKAYTEAIQSEAGSTSSSYSTRTRCDKQLRIKGLYHEIQMKQASSEALHRMVMFDPLTGLYIRRFVETRIEAEACAVPTERPATHTPASPSRSVQGRLTTTMGTPPATLFCGRLRNTFQRPSAAPI
jgi:hypothetical protein